MDAQKCRTCPATIYYLKKYDPATGQISDKSNPIDATPHKDGNLIINREKGLYRFATANEKEVAKNDEKNLYISHFATCPDAATYKKK